MKTSCLINNYNYGHYLAEAVTSALNQTVKFDEIIIVDDASTDNSQEIIAQLAQETGIKYLFKEKNQGQLSSFNEGFLAATGDIIFFLDADDIYDSQYLEKSLDFYKRHSDCDFLFSGYHKFGAVEEKFLHFNIDLDLGFSVIRTLCMGDWIGSITSTISMRREILSKFLPIPYLDDWRSRADDCLVWGASLVGAKKFHMAEALVMYRIHQKNQYYNNSHHFLGIDKTYEYKRFYKCNSLFNYIIQKNNFTLPLCFTLSTLNEFKTIPCPNSKDFITYLKIIFLVENNLYSKIKGIFWLLSYYLKLLMMGKLKK